LSENILVIKLGALGDFVQAGGPFAAIREHHRGGFITLLTTLPFAEFAAEAPWFNEIRVDRRPKFWQAGDWLGLRNRLRGGGFSRVYDLQTSDRSSFYYRLFWPGPYPEWSGIARACSHPHANPRRDFMHTQERQAEQLAMAGISSVAAADYSWADASAAAAFELSGPYAMLVPGGARHRPEKRWPAARFAAIASGLAEAGITPVIIGTAPEQPIAAEIISAEPRARDLTGKTSIRQLFGLAKEARLALGNDSGPMHAAAVIGCPAIVLYSEASDPVLCAQRGPKTSILRRNRLQQLSLAEVTDAIADALPPAPRPTP
jgi:ADP-heptose:LPS heptosyltransferase